MITHRLIPGALLLSAFTSLPTFAQEATPNLDALALANKAAQVKTERLARRHSGATLALRLEENHGLQDTAKNWTVVSFLKEVISIRKSNPNVLESRSASFAMRVFNFTALDQSSVEVTRDDGVQTRLQLDQNRHAIKISSLGGLTGLNDFPLAVPRLDPLLERDSILEERTQPLPKLSSEQRAAFKKAKMKAIVDELNISPNDGSLVWLKGQDDFAREVRVLWRKGDPWPLYQECDAGAAYLARGME